MARTLSRRQRALLADLQRQLNKNEGKIADCLIANKPVPAHLQPRSRRLLRQISRIGE